MNSRITVLVLSAVLIAAVVSGCVQDVSDHGIETPGGVPQSNVTPSLPVTSEVMPTPTPQSDVTPGLIPSPVPSPVIGPQEMQVDAALSDYPRLFEKDVIIVIGENVSKTVEHRGQTVHLHRHLSWMSKCSDELAKNLYNLTGNTPVIKTDAELTARDRTECNLILLGHPLQVLVKGRPPDANTVITEIYESNPSMKRVTYNYPGRWKGVLKLIKNPWNPEKCILIVSGCDDYGRKAVLAQLEQIYEINETSVIVEWEYEQKEIHKDLDTTSALAGLLEPYVSDITMEDIGFEVSLPRGHDDVYTLSEDGKPSVPFIIKEFKILGNSDVESVNVSLSNPIEIHNIFIKPVQPPVPCGSDGDYYWQNYTPPPYTIDNETYASSEPHPGKEYNYRLSGDPIHGGEVVVHIFPIQYIPAESRIIAYRNASVSIFYRVPVPAQEAEYSWRTWQWV